MIPVSYTHLDVYKRQVLYYVTTIQFLRFFNQFLYSSLQVRLASPASLHPSPHQLNATRFFLSTNIQKKRHERLCENNIAQCSVEVIRTDIGS